MSLQRFGDIFHNGGGHQHLLGSGNDVRQAITAGGVELGKDIIQNQDGA